jgi:hypothetical protein
MTKRGVLEIFAATSEFMTPDDVAIRLRGAPYRSSVYSYLARLHQQGLLVRDRRWGPASVPTLEQGNEAFEISERARTAGSVEVTTWAGFV